MKSKEIQDISASFKVIDRHFIETVDYGLSREFFLNFTFENLKNIDFNQRKYATKLKDTLADILKFNEIINNNKDITKDLSDYLKLGEKLKVRQHILYSNDFERMDLHFLNGLFKSCQQWINYANSNGVEIEFDFKERIDKMNEALTELNAIEDSLTELDNIINHVKTNNRNPRLLKNIISRFEHEFQLLVNPIRIPLQINTLYSILEQNYQSLCDGIDSLYNFMKASRPELVDTMADKYIKSSSDVVDSDIKTFLSNKEQSINIEHSIVLKGQPLKSLILFKDGSFLESKKGEHHELKTVDQYLDGGKYREYGQAIVAHLLRKKPKLINLFKNYVEEEDLNRVLTVIDSYLHFNDVLKSKGFDLLQESLVCDFSHRSLEVIDDKINAIILEHKTEQYINSILSNKYEHLISNEIKEQFKILFENNVSKNSLQEFIGKKLAAVKTSDDFLIYVKKVVDHFTSFNRESLFSKLDNLNIIPVYDSDNVIVFPVNTFDESKILGSVSWCISRNSSYFNEYTENDSKQYFLYNFNKKEENKESMIGFTIFNTGEFRVSHLKNDDSFNFKKEHESIYLTVLENDRERYSKLSDYFVNLFDEKNSTIMKKHKQVHGL